MKWKNIKEIIGEMTEFRTLRGNFLNFLLAFLIFYTFIPTPASALLIENDDFSQSYSTTTTSSEINVLQYVGQVTASPSIPQLRLRYGTSAATTFHNLNVYGSLDQDFAHSSVLCNGSLSQSSAFDSFFDVDLSSCSGDLNSAYHIWIQFDVASASGETVTVYGSPGSSSQKSQSDLTGFSISDTYSNIVNTNDRISPVNRIFFQFTLGEDLPPETDFTNTRIIDFNPQNNSTTTSPVTFSLHAYINPVDIGSTFSVSLSLRNIDQNVLLLGDFSPGTFYLLDHVQATSSGDFYYTSDPVALADGNYRVMASISRTYFGGFITNPWADVSESQSHQFIVGTSTFIGSLSQNGFNELQDILGNTAATSTAAAARTCIPLGDFDPIQCGAFLFIPGGEYLNNTMQGLRDGVLTRVPFGYATRLVTIWNTTATSSLPAITGSFRAGPGNEEYGDLEEISYTIDPAEMLAGGAALLENTRDPIYGKNYQDVFGPILRLIFALGVFVTIVWDIAGIYHSQGKEPRENSNQIRT